MALGFCGNVPGSIKPLIFNLNVYATKGHPPTIIDTPERVSQLMDDLLLDPTENLYVDLEGENLCRHGTITIVAIHLIEPRQTYLVDVHTLGDAASHTPAATDNTTTLKTILESPTRTKVFLDVRSDSDALRVLYDILLQGAEDVQIMELGFRQCTGGWLRRLGPAAGDVVLLPQRRREYIATLDDFQMWSVERETAVRWEESQDDGYVLRGRRKALVPWAVGDFENWNKEYNRMIEDEYYPTENHESEASDAENYFFWSHQVSFWFYEVAL
ncbi:hypothetical protein ASPACDRAFT_40761 [Aspergillus aculeatus ATCC 16872]|uniref:3'-5' exonuclease domain-containing protein n=1 Tax=Aspergillus aculeatus (strain ATCC 16872 / CBS 172.66 / WB 5094) TaxID=690307 RepID=A0A1L9X0M7_ASPA1|nr:uncharacterized protein ASPACDRAFT_40761 [Aspergillus aculeatus ATCC 16872]OJK01944.1 hypothetical protein ASPACDRAFT_40761 [Aspergillus aculeatus ATCC 16872]